MRRTISSWSDVRLDDLFFAYRKAKADCYYETSVRVAEKFIEYESDLAHNLEELLIRINENQIPEIFAEGLGSPVIFPKKVSLNAKSSSSKSHAFFSDAKRAFSAQAGNGLTPEFRMIGDFSVEVHVLSGLWGNLVGHKFDAALGKSAVASRLRRYRAAKDGDEVGMYHLEAIGSFEPYFAPYRRWRDEGMDAIKNSITDGVGVVALTLDISNFYHRISPKFATDVEFLRYAEIELSTFDIEFTEQFIAFLDSWSAACMAKMEAWGCGPTQMAGLPIGLTIVRVLSNSILVFLDREIERLLSPTYYARYVDDVFLVIKDSENFVSSESVWEFLEGRLPVFNRIPQSGAVKIKLPSWGEGSDLFFQTEKQKCFFLSGKSGLDLIDNIASQIREVSSERRLMPLPEHLEQSQSAKALTATDSADDADSLRRADGLTLRRLGWSVLLRTIEILSRDLNPNDWIEERQKFYDFAHDHVIRPDKILEQIDRLPRLFAVAVSLGDWKPAARIWKETLNSTYELERATRERSMKINGAECQKAPQGAWEETRAQVKRFFREAFIRAYPCEVSPPKSRAFSRLAADLDLSAAEIASISRRARETDWARIPYKEHLRLFAERHSPSVRSEDQLAEQYRHLSQLRLFLVRSVTIREDLGCDRVKEDLREVAYDSLLPYLFPTRAYSPEEIALYLPSDCVTDEPTVAAINWAEYTRAVRGVWVRSDLAEDGELESETIEFVEESDGPCGDEDSLPPPRPSPKHITLDQRPPDFPVRVGITSFSTSDHTWALAAAGKPDVSPERYKAIARIVNHALTEDRRPHYLILPELSLPERWVRTVSSMLRDGNISLIAGLDYRRHIGNLIDSSAVLVLNDERLGYPAAIQVRQRKSQPAPEEEKLLIRSHGQTWLSPGLEFKPVYVHRNFHFSVLVCSELQNIEYRAHLQGFVDSLFVISWNRDLETFAALVDSASLDVHTYVALSNNLRFGDSRVRRPAKQAFEREVCRVRGGINNQLVIVQIDPRKLRAQQSRAKRWPEKTDAYKPAPENFKISQSRESVPD